MAKKLTYERYFWFHGQVKENHFPNASKLAHKFEISIKQAQRDIEFIRDRLQAPLEYVSARKGYRYENHSYELPPIWLKEEELIAFCLAYRLASSMPDKNLKTALHLLLQKILAFRFFGVSPGLQDINEKVSVKNIEYYRVKQEVFHQVIAALFGDQSLKISYHTPHKDETTKRIIKPLHLLCYMGSWHLIAYCTLRKELRDFALSRIQIIESVAQTIPLPESLPSIKEYIRKNFGLMSGNTSIEICLRFAPEVSKWVLEQIWHSGQHTSLNKDGTLSLTFPVSDFREVRREILKFGSSVEVLSPAELREEIINEIIKMSSIYK